MQKLPIYQVDAFTQQLFAGNPAAVCPLEHWLPDPLLQLIALENNLSETAFIVGENGRYRIRWFTPATEVRLCGHATLAASHVIRHELGDLSDRLEFESLSGILQVSFPGELIQLDFPVSEPFPGELPTEIARSLPFRPVEVLNSRDDFLIIAPDESTVAALELDFSNMREIQARGVIISALTGRDNVDFVSRWFGGPETGITEDPVTGSAHTVLAPYWSQKLDRSVLRAEQISPRGGQLECEMMGDRVLIRGRAVQFLKGEIRIPKSGEWND